MMCSQSTPQSWHTPAWIEDHENSAPRFGAAVGSIVLDTALAAVADGAWFLLENLHSGSFDHGGERCRPNEVCLIRPVRLPEANALLEHLINRPSADAIYNSATQSRQR